MNQMMFFFFIFPTPTISTFSFHWGMSDDEWNCEDAFLSDPTFMGPSAKRPLLDLDTSVHSLQQFEEQLQREIEQLESILGMSRALAKFLLMRCKWNKERVMESWMDDKKKLLVEMGLLLPHMDEDAPLPVPQVQTRSTFSCPICFADDESQPVFSLACAHAYCLSCYSQYVQTKIAEADIKTLKCPAQKCPLFLMEDSVKVLVDSCAFKKYCDWYLRQFIDEIPYYKWCPSPDCQTVIECHIPSAHSLKVLSSIKLLLDHSHRRLLHLLPLFLLPVLLA